MRIERDEYLSYRAESAILKQRQFTSERDMLRIAFHLFIAERNFKDTGSIGKITIPISTESTRKLDVLKLTTILRDLILLTLFEKISVKVEAVDDVSGRRDGETRFTKKDAIVLFSGGLDSYAGITVAEKEFKRLLGVFIAHRDQPRIINIVNNMKPRIKTEIRTIHAPGMGSTGYSQLRGFLYILCAGVYASLCNSRRILVTECGPTMYQPLFSTYDSITYTTHPYVLRAAKDVLELLLNSKIDIITPFEDLTKAEVVTASGLKDFSETHSCITQRFGNHDGTCFGCVTKRLACLVGGVKDVKYKMDVLSKNANQDNLLSLLEFSDNIINDTESVLPHQRQNIDEFGKSDLFRRYALDNLAGLMLGTGKNHVLHRRFISSEKSLKERIQEVRRKANKPDFNKVVS